MKKNNRFKLEKSQDLPGWWVLTDTENLIVCKFKEHEYNETQKISVLEEETLLQRMQNPAAEIPKIMSEMGDYMFSHWYSIALPTPAFEFREDDENDRLLLIRNKFPKLTIEVQDDCNLKQLSDALEASSEFVAKYNIMKKNDKRNNQGGNETP